MWNKRSDGHYSDDVLLSHLDGEARGLDRLRVAAHLHQCWECRARLSELEHQAEELARLARKQYGGQAARTARARANFLAWREAFEKDQAPSTTRRGVSMRWLVACAAAACLAVFFLVPRPQRTAPALGAADVLRGVESYQRQVKLQAGAVHQVLRVDVAETRPAKRHSSGRVEIWTDAAGKRYASRWTGERAQLKHAVWKQAGQAPVEVGATPITFDRLDGANLTVESVEAAFFNWLRSRDWEMTPGWSGAVSADGTQLRLERVGEDGLRLRAQRAGDTVRMDFSMDVDAGTYRPRLQLMRFESRDRTLELRVVLDRLEVVPVERIDAAVFEPERARPTAAPAPLPLLAANVPETTLPALAPAGNFEPEVEFAIHRVRACVGDSVQVSTGPDGEIEVRAMVRSNQRRIDLANALEQVRGARLHSEIQVIGGARPGPERNHPLLPPGNVRMIDGLYREALALVRLAERYGPEKRGALQPGQARLIDMMVRDHVAALRVGSRAARAELEPALRSLGGAPVVGPALPDAPDWAAASMGVFRALDQADNLLEVQPPGARNQAASRLMGTLEEIDRRIAQLENAVAAAKR